MGFEKIETKKKGAYIIEQIIKTIKNGEYKVGDKLPSEREIADEMGVSRPSIREAFSALQIAGIIESRSGDGTYVKRSGKLANLDSQALSILKEDEDPYVIWEARKSIECGIVELIANRANSKDIREMEQALKGMRKAAEYEDYNKYFKSDRDFHLAMGRAAHNPFIEGTIRSLVNVMKQRLWQEIKREYHLRTGNLKESFEDHQRIFEAIKIRNKDLLSDALSKHFVKFGECTSNEPKFPNEKSK